MFTCTNYQDWDATVNPSHTAPDIGIGAGFGPGNPPQKTTEELLKKVLEELGKRGEEESLDSLKVAELLAGTLPRFYLLGDGLYWDDMTQEVRRLSTIIPGMATHTTSSERRRIRKAVKREKKIIIRREQKWFEDLTHYASLIGKEGDLFSLIGDPAGNAESLPAEVYEAIVGIRKLFENGNGKNIILSYFIWLTNDIASEILENKELKKKYIKSTEAFTRNRKLKLSDMFIILLTMAGDNLNNEVYEYFKLKPVQATPQAFVERRNLIEPECFEYYYKRLTQACNIICLCMPTTDVFSEFEYIFGADGSDVNVAHNPFDEDTYIDGGKGGKGWNQYHVNVFHEQRFGMIANALIQPKRKTHETQAAVEMIRSMEFKKLALFLGDRGYACLNLLETIRRKENLECLIRAKEDWIKEIAQLPMEEFDMWMNIHVITTQTKFDKERVKKGEAKYLSGVSKFGKNKTSKVWDYESEVDVRFRAVRVKLDSGWETLITTLDEKKYPPEKLKELYFLRWGGVENAFRVLKWDNHLAQMHCKKLDFAKQEIWARLAMFNIVSCVINCAYAVEKQQLQWDVKAARALEEQKHPKIINRRFATHVICDCFKNAGDIKVDVIQLILQYKTPVRPGRSYKRDMRAIGFAQFLYR